MNAHAHAGTRCYIFPSTTHVFEVRQSEHDLASYKRSTQAYGQTHLCHMLGLITKLALETNTCAYPPSTAGEHTQHTHTHTHTLYTRQSNHTHTLKQPCPHTHAPTATIAELLCTCISRHTHYGKRKLGNQQQAKPGTWSDATPIFQISCPLPELLDLLMIGTLTLLKACLVLLHATSASTVAKAEVKLQCIRIKNDGIRLPTQNLHQGPSKSSMPDQERGDHRNKLRAST